MAPNNDLLNLKVVCGNGSMFGETVQKFIEENNGHKTGFRHAEKHGHCRI